MIQSEKPDWVKIRMMFVHGGKTVAQIASETGIKHDTVKKRSDRERWGAERTAAEQRNLAEAAKQAAEKRVSDLLQFNSDDLKVARAIRAKLAKRLSQEGLDLSSSELRQIASAAEAAQRIGRLALGASTDNVGHAGEGGEGPIKHADVSVDAYLAARAKVIDDF